MGPLRASTRGYAGSLSFQLQQHPTFGVGHTLRSAKEGNATCTLATYFFFFFNLQHKI